MNNWLVASYKINEIQRLESNLMNQKFKYYIPRVTIKKKTYAKPKCEVLFPGYIFVNTSHENYSALRYTTGIKNIIKFGENISYMTDLQIKKIKNLEASSKLEPIISKVKIGQEALIAKGSFKGMVVKICSLPSKQRVDVLMSLLGSVRRVNISQNKLTF